MIAELSCRALKSLLVHFRHLRGDAALRATVAQLDLGPGIDVAYLEAENRWVSFAVGQRVLDGLAEASGDPRFPRNAGLVTGSKEVLGLMYTVVRAFGSPRLCYQKTLDISSTYNRVGHFAIGSIARSRVAITYSSTAREPNRRFCDYRMGQFESFPTIWGLPPARARELACQVEGAPACSYEFEWLNGTSQAVTALGGLVGAVGLAAAGPLVGLPWTDPAVAGVGALLGAGLTGLAQARRQISQRDQLLGDQSDDLLRSVQDLQSRFVEIQGLNATLEQKVAVRTSELQIASDRLTAALERQVELDRLKTQFFTNVSHELRTPLTLILSPLETLLTGPPLPDTVSPQLETMHRNSLRLLRHINALLDLSRLDGSKERLKLEDADVAELLRGLTESARDLALRRGIELTLDLDDPLGALPSIPLDRDKVEKIFLNLLSNALKFTPAPGRSTGHVRVRAGTASGRLRVAVEDTGAGIPADHLERVFERFHQVDSSTSRRYEGTGIGLALAKELAELHMGTIEVRSQPGVGSSFTVTLPLERSAYPEARLDRRQGTVPVVLERRGEERSGQLRELFTDPAALTLSDLSEVRVNPATPGDLSRPLLLVVDDNHDMLNYLSSLLGRDYRVITAQDGDEAYRLAVQQQPALVISDVMMPRRSGDELVRDLRADPRTRHVAVILVTAKAALQSKIEGLEGGADDYLTKPFSFLELKARIRSLLEQRKLQRELAERNDYLDKMNFDLVLAKKEVFLQTIEALAFAVEAKDPYTHGHSRRVSILSEALARQMRLPEGRIERARIAAVLHDIGKLGIPDGIINKRSRLNADEYRKIKLHPLLGYRILEKIKDLADVSRCILHHHERFDGGGYPESRRGDDIPLEARIIAVADTYDAMTSDRSYRKGLTHAAAIAEIRRTAGSQLDPACVEQFLALYEVVAPAFPPLPSAFGDLLQPEEPEPEPGAISQSQMRIGSGPN